jgi:hypothetical protein
MLPRVSCTLPALAAGTYSLEVSGQGTGVGLPPRTLVVSDSGTATSCKLPQGGTTAAPIDAASYATSCAIDTDCARATVGDICSPCKCPNAAIATSAADAYAADYRATASQCQPLSSGVACAACAPMKAQCDFPPGAATGSCKLVPGP